MSALLDITDDSFKAEVLDSTVPVLVDYWAPWCAPCKRLTPILEEIAAENADKIKIVKLNIDDHQKIAMEQQVTSVPTLQLYVGGSLSKTVMGAKPKPALLEELKEVLS